MYRFLKKTEENCKRNVWHTACVKDWAFSAAYRPNSSRSKLHKSKFPLSLTHSCILWLSSGRREAEWDHGNWWKIVVDVLTLTTNVWQLCWIQPNAGQDSRWISGSELLKQKLESHLADSRKDSTWTFVLARSVFNFEASLFFYGLS